MVEKLEAKPQRLHAESSVPFILEIIKPLTESISLFMFQN